MSEKGIMFPLEKIKINKENFRHTPTDSELSAIKYLMDEDLSSYEELINSMYNDLRTFPILLLKKNSTYELMDANRRMSVIKITNHPELIPNGDEYNTIRNLCKSHQPFEKTDFIADIYHYDNKKDVEDLMKALDELHLRDSKTKKDWNAVSQYRASAYIGATIKHPWVLTMLYYYDENYIIEITPNKTDTFNRIMRKKELKIDESGKILLDNDKKILDRIVQTVVNNKYFLNEEKIVVNTRTKSEYFKTIVIDIINSVNEQPHSAKEKSPETKKKPDQANQTADSNKTEKEQQDEPYKEDSNKTEKKDPSKFRLNELYVIEGSKIKLEQHQAFLNIRKELEKLASGQFGYYRTYKLSTYYLIRALIEQCLKYWLSAYHLKTFNKCVNNQDANLGKMIDQINKKIKNGNDIFFSDLINKRFTIFFDNHSTKDTLDLMIHHPYLLSDDINKLHDYTSGILFEILNYILTYVDTNNSGHQH